jgi:FixJ family two-component response regulator
MTKTEKEVYIVDDDASVCRALKYLLMTFGFAAHTYLSAEEFFGAVPDSTAGCLVMDFHMPGMDGLEGLKRVKDSGNGRPVIIISADKNGGLRERALVAGAAGFFQKPVNGQELADLINKIYSEGSV